MQFSLSQSGELSEEAESKQQTYCEFHADR